MNSLDTRGFIFIENKGEAPFNKFKFHIEKQSECKLKRQRTDGGGEHTSIEFARF